MGDDIEQIQQAMLLITEQALMQQQAHDILMAAYPTDVVGINVMDELSHRVVEPLDDSAQ